MNTFASTHTHTHQPLGQQISTSKIKKNSNTEKNIMLQWWQRYHVMLNLKELTPDLTHRLEG